MKNLLFFLTILCISLSSLTAQTITWTGAGDGTNWSDVNNWDLVAVPTATNDVVIPTGFSVTLNVAGSVKSIDLQGTSTFNINTNFTFTDASNLGDNSIVNWASGILNGGGTLTNHGTINLITTTAKIISGNTTLNNTGTINITTTGDLYITDGVVNNQESGIIDLQSDGGNITFSGGTTHILNNSGTIKITGVGFVSILAELHNNNGTITVESGILILNNPTIVLTSGVYNVSSGGELRWASTVSCTGILTGTIEGNLNWAGTVNVATAATFNFSGTQGLNWSSNFLSGGGTLTNKGTINLISTGSKIITEDTTLNNEGTINITTTGDLYITDGVVNNQESGIIDLQSDGGNITFSGGTTHILNNSGIIKRTIGTGVAQILVETNNSGTIEVMMGELEFAGTLGLNNLIDGIIKGIATVDLPVISSFTNEGTFEPGASPGTLTVQGDFTSNESSILVVELNGLAQGTEYDLLAIQGNAIMDGVVNVTMGFEGSINDEFIVASTTGTITQCTLVSTATSIFDGQQYDFNVACRNDNEVVLTIVDKALGIGTNELANVNILLFPNPASENITLRNDSDLILQSATIIDLRGRIIKTVDLTGMNHDGVISLNNYASGHYFVKINSDDGSIIKRFIKL